MDFYNYICTYKEKIDSIKGMVNFTNEESDDTDELKVFKIIAKDICYIFLEYYAANWIYGS